jgi:hypothetical protein
MSDHPQHHIYFVIEGGELVEISCEHSGDCISTVDHDGRNVVIADPEKCDLAFEEEQVGFDQSTRSEDEPPPWEGLDDGAYRMKMDYHWRYFKPVYPHYEADVEFWWWAEGEPEKVGS